MGLAGWQPAPCENHDRSLGGERTGPRRTALGGIRGISVLITSQVWVLVLPWISYTQRPCNIAGTKDSGLQIRDGDGINICITSTFATTFTVQKKHRLTSLILISLPFLLQHWVCSTEDESGIDQPASMFEHGHGLWNVPKRRTVVFTLI